MIQIRYGLKPDSKVAYFTNNLNLRLQSGVEDDIQIEFIGQGIVFQISEVEDRNDITIQGDISDYILKPERYLP